MQSTTNINQYSVMFYYFQDMMPDNIPNANPLPEPDTLGFVLISLAIAGIVCSFFFIVQSLNLQKALFHRRKVQFLNSYLVLILPVLWCIITILIWFGYITFVNFAYIQSYNFPLEFYVYNPRVLLKGLLLGNIIPALIALYSVYILHNQNRNTKDEKSSEIAKRSSILGLVFNLINLIGSIITIFVFIKS